MIKQAKFAVVVVVLRRREGVWECVQVARKIDHSQWTLPGGKVEPDETPAEGAARELLEETGIVAHVSYLVPQETVLDSDGYLTTYYLLGTSEDLPQVFEKIENEAPVRWGPVSDLLNGPYGAEHRQQFTKMGVIKP